MSLITLGLNHKTAPVAIREKVAFTPERLPVALRDVVQLNGVREAAILSTCNRTELYCTRDHIVDRYLVEWFSHFHGLNPQQLRQHLYLHDHISTIRHALRVASGLDSMVLGEPQILGQMKQAYAKAKECNAIGHMLGKLFQHSFSVAKQVRTDTAIGSSAVSVAFAAVSLAKQIFGDLDNYTALMIGAGETIELASRHLQTNKIGKIIVANRSEERARKLADQFDGEAITLHELGENLHRADIVISSTASPLPILGKGAVERALKIRKRRPMFVVDIAVPRDVEPEVANLDDVYLYTVDNLQEIIQENLKSRQQAAIQAEEIIDNEVQGFLNWQNSLGAVDAIRELRQSAEILSTQILQKAHNQLASGRPPEEVLKLLSHTLTNKLMHQPCFELRNANEEEREQLILAARRLFLGTNN